MSIFNIMIEAGKDNHTDILWPSILSHRLLQKYLDIAKRLKGKILVITPEMHFIT